MNKIKEYIDHVLFTKSKLIKQNRILIQKVNRCLLLLDRQDQKHIEDIIIIDKKHDEVMKMLNTLSVKISRIKKEKEKK